MIVSAARHDEGHGLEDDGEHIKETFAHFGRAMYAASVFEAGLAISLMTLDFLRTEAVRLRKAGRAAFDRAKYEADFDAFMKRQHAQSLGNLIRGLSKAVDLSPDLKSLIDQAKIRRDFLAHHFFRERAVEFASQAGRVAMIEELERDHDLFEEADRAIDALVRPHRAALGMTDEILQSHYHKFLREEVGEA